MNVPPVKNYIYTIFEVDTGDVIYVGRTANLNGRFSLHRGNLIKKHDKPCDFKVIEEVYWFEATNREYYWIKYFHAMGSPLVNIHIPLGRRVLDTTSICKAFLPKGYKHKILMA